MQLPPHFVGSPFELSRFGWFSSRNCCLNERQQTKRVHEETEALSRSSFPLPLFSWFNKLCALISIECCRRNTSLFDRQLLCAFAKRELRLSSMSKYSDLNLGSNPSLLPPNCSSYKGQQIWNQLGQRDKIALCGRFLSLFCGATILQFNYNKTENNCWQTNCWFKLEAPKEISWRF